MNRENTPKTPTQTIDLFSWDFLKQHHKTQPIIRKYFGEIGAEVFRHNGRTFNSGLDYNPIADNFIREINQIQPQELLDNNFFFRNLENPWEKFKAAKKFIFDRPYFYLFTDSDQRNLAALLLLLDENLDLPSPQYRQDTMRYIHFCNLRSFNLSEDQIENAKTALTYYRANYILAKLGPRKTQKLLEQFFDSEHLDRHAGKFYDFIDVAIGELHSENMFLHQSKPRKIDVKELEDFDKLFKYPEWIEFTDAAHQETIRRILKNELTDWQIQYYLQTYIEPHNYTNLYPALKHVLQTTNDFVTFYCTGDYLNLIWKNIPSGELNDWFEREIYDIYWSRIGGIWPFQHPHELNAKEVERCHDKVGIDDFLTGRADQLLQSGSIMDDAMNWITCLDKTNPELEKYFKKLAKRDFNEIRANFPQGVQKRVFTIKHKKLSPKEQAAAVFREFDGSDIAWRYLAYPTNIEEAKITLEKIFDSETYLFNQLFALEQLVLTGNVDKVGAYILNYLVDNFAQFSADLHHNPECIISIFTAACSGATEYSEIEPLEKLADQCRKLDFADDEYRKLKSLEIDGALAYAKDIIEKFNRQRDDLAQNLRSHTEAVAEQSKDIKNGK